jgi:hypothetical protein
VKKESWQVEFHRRKVIEQLYELMLGKGKRIGKSHKAWMEKGMDIKKNVMAGMVVGKKCLN